ncbi:MAG: hypothetical protein Q9191_002848 [Dirinaria sp. TL-2023a]
MDFLGRYLKRFSRTNDEQRFEKVMIGKDYFGTKKEEWFDAATTPFHSEEKLGETSGSKSTLKESKHRRSEASAPSTEPKESSARDSSAHQSKSTLMGEQRQPTQTSSAEKADELIPILIKLYRLGEELVPLLVALAKIGEEWSHMSPTPHQQYPHPWPESNLGDREAMVPGSSTSMANHGHLTPTASKPAGNVSRAKTSTSTDTEDSAPTPSTSLSRTTEEENKLSHPQSEAEDADFGLLKSICSREGLLRRPAGIGEHDVSDGINDDATLRRFFDARKHDVSAAHKQFKEAWDAREARNLVAAHTKTSGDMKALKSELKIPDSVPMASVRAFAYYEFLTRFIMPLCTSVPGRPNQERAVTKTLCIVDISGISLKQVWSLRGWIQDLAKMFATNYPEILSRVFIIGAPSYFPTIWGWIKKWVDPGTFEKLFILSPEEVLPTLQQHVEMADIPQRFGGEFESYHGMQPMLDPVISGMLNWQSPHKDLPKGPIKWIDEGWGRRAAVAVGSKEGRARKEKIATVGSKKRSRK